MKFFILILALSLSFCLNAQNINFRVVDSKTGEGIPNVNALLPETLNGTIADSIGNISFSNDLKRNNLFITRIGYRDTLIAIDGLQNKVIKLEAKVYNIPEITVIEKVTKELLIGCQKKNPKGLTISNNVDGGYFIYFNRSSNARLNSIGINITMTEKSNVELYIRVLEPDTTYKTLGKDMMATYKKLKNLHNGWNDIDFTNENIRFSQNGLIIQFYITVLEGFNGVTINCSSNETDYTWMSSTDFRKDFPLSFGNKNYRPAIRLKIKE
jgi:hypothetical protein